MKIRTSNIIHKSLIFKIKTISLKKEKKQKKKKQKEFFKKERSKEKPHFFQTNLSSIHTLYKTKSNFSF